jgi:hypothetical protein
MTVAEFENGYWYATELKTFARKIGISGAAALRKDEIEAAIKRYLNSGEIAVVAKRSQGPRDVVALKAPVINYSNHPSTKDFLEREALRMDPNYKRRSGARYRLNRWREAQTSPITYRDLVAEYVRLSAHEGPFEKAPVVRYVNFLSDFLKANPRATHAEARAAWHEVKAMDARKEYREWAKRKGDI